MGKITPPPVVMKVNTIPLVCKFCGAPLHGDTCDYCRVEYKKEIEP